MIYGVINFSDFGGNLEAFVETLAKANELLKARGIVAPVQLSNNIDSALQSEKITIPKNDREVDENGLPIIRRDFGSPLVNLWCAIKGYDRFRCKKGKSREEAAYLYLTCYLKKGDFGFDEKNCLKMIAKGTAPLTYTPDCVDATLDGDAGTLDDLPAMDDGDTASMVEESEDDDDGNAY